MTKEIVGIESSLVSAWEGWDEFGPTDLYFYNVTLREDVFGKEFINSLEGKVVDLGMYLQSSSYEIIISGEESAIRSGKLRLVLED